jgi:hypothetical protein
MAPHSTFLYIKYKPARLDGGRKGGELFGRRS